ncbi:hypothetical protein WICPIJ_000689 [Wickerhamomyces pijperi]|uniref:Helicase SWR1 n=1 Tax=Wickerhamomyces pijperi TaxID=599730 RepID=A0A9P8TRP7_WICPI|nr:hypothetical protein WICPIJ_000689 [Wickerhamomyces pijperi]
MVNSVPPNHAKRSRGDSLTPETSSDAVEIIDEIDLNPHKRRKSSRSVTTKKIDYTDGLRKSSVNGVKPVSNSTGHVNGSKQGKVQIEQVRPTPFDSLSDIEQLSYLETRHKLLANELYHLNQFTSLATWDQRSTPSTTAQDFYKTECDLWELTATKTNGGNNSLRSKRSSRVKAADPLTAKVDAQKQKFTEELFNPQRYFEEETKRREGHLAEDELSENEQHQRHKSIPKNSKSLSKSKNSTAKGKASVKKELTPVLPEEPEVEEEDDDDDEEEEQDEDELDEESEESEEDQDDEVEEFEESSRPQYSRAKSKSRSKPTSKSKSKYQSKSQKPTRRPNTPITLTESDEELLIDSEDEAIATLLSDPKYQVPDSPEPFIKDPNAPIPRISLTIAPKPQVLMNKSHFSEPKHGGSLSAYLDSFKSLDDGDVTQEEYEKFTKDQHDLLVRIQQAIDKDILTVDPKDVTIRKQALPQPYKNPLITQPSHHDHFLGQAQNMSKLFADMKKSRTQRQRKINMMIENHFKRLATAEERKVKEQERRVKALAKNVVTMVKRRWVLAEKAYRVLKGKEMEELKRIKGKEHLSQMLEHSTQLLEAQMTKAEDEDELNDDDDEDEEEENDDEDQGEHGNDEELTVEELKKKYAHLEGLKLEDVSTPELDSTPGPAPSETEREEEEDTVKPQILEIETATPTPEPSSIPTTAEPEIQIELTNEEKQAVDSIQKEKHDSLLDSDTELSDSDDESDFDSDDEDSGEEEEEESGEEDATANGVGGGLASLFGTVHRDEDEEEDQDVEFEDEEDEQADDEVDEEGTVEQEDVEMKDAVGAQTNGKANAIEEEEEEEASTEANIESEQANDADEMDIDTETKPISNSDSGSREPTPVMDQNGVIDVPNPSALLRGNLRYYQKQGLNWLASLYNNNTNGILADEMGLGKTIQTISLISYLAVTKQIWGPHLIVVPTSVLLNWEMEFKRFAPGMKVLVYYGSPQQRKEKRKGWNKPDTFHVCITSYQLVCQDQQVFKRKKWRYMILDEAHNIKNFKSNRWNALLNFNTENRLLLTGTPLQNNIMELWSLLYFLMPSSKNLNQSMPSGFANLDDFQQWFGKPVDSIIQNGKGQEVDEETKKTVSKLHQVLRPYLLRRLKADVESQMPGKYEHVVNCKLSKRQYKLYHEYLARSDTKEMLKNGNYISIINCLMQLRKVCNHPDLFEERPIVTSFVVNRSVCSDYDGANAAVLRLLRRGKEDREVNFDLLNLNFGDLEYEDVTTSQFSKIQSLKSSKSLQAEIDSLKDVIAGQPVVQPNYSDINQYYQYVTREKNLELLSNLNHLVYLNELRCEKTPLYGKNTIKTLSVLKPTEIQTTAHQDLLQPLSTRILTTKSSVETFAFVTPAIVCLDQPELHIPKSTQAKLPHLDNVLHHAQTKLSIQFPDKSLLLYDSGKLQKLSKLLMDLQVDGHRALIFTQMTKVLDILERFLNIMGIRYMRLDGSTKIEDRQILTERFNSDPKIQVFILSTRSGGLGINLTGADTVIFYDSDWNPAMDKQCQDRCHRIGQTRDVHIYRFVSEFTIESNILRKANQKRHLDDVVIQEGEFTTDYFGKLSFGDLIGSEEDTGDAPLIKETKGVKFNNLLAQAEDDADALAAKEAMKEVELDNEDFEDEAEEKKEDNGELIEDDDDGVGHIDEYMIRYIANGYYFD